MAIIGAAMRHPTKKITDTVTATVMPTLVDTCSSLSESTEEEQVHALSDIHVHIHEKAVLHLFSHSDVCAIACPGTHSMIYLSYMHSSSHQC